MPLSGVVPSPNIWRSPDAYEIENRAVDPDGVIESAMVSRHDWAGLRLLDVGCGSGYHLARWAERASEVIGVEPHEPLLQLARSRVAELPTAVSGRILLRLGTAQQLPLPDACVDVMQARWSYFFGPGCEAGLAELARVMRPGGTAFVIDNDARRSTFGAWFRRALPRYDPVAVERFWARRGWSSESLDIRWSFASRADLAAVVRIEFNPELADAILAEHEGTEVDYAVRLRWRAY